MLDKRTELVRLARARQATRWNGYKSIGDYHGGVYECDHVSPYTKTAGNTDAEVMVILQDWASDEGLRGPFSEDSATLGHTPHLPTNRNLTRLLQMTFGLSLSDVYGTNVFPFVKLGGMSAAISQRDLVAAARQFTLPEIRIVNSKLVICLGKNTFNALREACGLNRCVSLASAIDSPFEIGESRVWCQAHTGALGQNNRNKGGVDRVTHDWLMMKGALKGAAIKKKSGDGARQAIEITSRSVNKRTFKVARAKSHGLPTEKNMNIFIFNNKAFERRHSEIYPLDNAFGGFAIYDYDERQGGRNPDLSSVKPGDLALVFGRDRTVKDVYRVTGIRGMYAPDVKKDVFVIYGELFGSLDGRMIYSQFIAANKLSCSRVDGKNNFTIGMIMTKCSQCEKKTIEELAATWRRA